MTDDKIVKETARDPEREALGPMHGGIRAAAKKVARKVAKKAGQKKATKKATPAAGKAAKRSTRSAKGADKAAPANVAAPTQKPAAVRTSTAKARTSPAGTATAASGAARASESVANTPATPVAPSLESGPSIETPRPPAPMHPGAAMESIQEHAGGMGGLLALWGPLIMVGFLVLVFRGGAERDSPAATTADAPNATAMDVAAKLAPGSQTRGAVDPAAGGRPATRMSAYPGAARGAAEAFDGGFAMRTSMAGPPVFAGRGSDARTPAVASGRLYPSPSGPYSDPRFRSLPTGESWSADGAGEWPWSAQGRASPGQEDGGDAPVQWVRCAAPYYWCPAPSSPAW